MQSKKICILEEKKILHGILLLFIHFIQTASYCAIILSQYITDDDVAKKDYLIRLSDKKLSKLETYLFNKSAVVQYQNYYSHDH